MFGNKRHYDLGYRQGEIDTLAAQDARKKQFRAAELSLYLDRPVIVIGNEWDDPTIGFGVSIDYLSRSLQPILVVQDYVTDRRVLVFGCIRPYTDRLYSAIKRLDPYDRWELVSSNSGSFESYNKPKSGSASTPEELDRKLEASGFFARVEEFRREPTNDE